MSFRKAFLGGFFKGKFLTCFAYGRSDNLKAKMVEKILIYCVAADGITQKDGFKRVQLNLLLAQI